VKVNIITETRKISAVSYVRDPRLASDQQGYISVGTLKTDKDLAKESIKYEFQRAYAHLHRAKTHAEILGMEDQVSASTQYARRRNGVKIFDTERLDLHSKMV
jgi:hypothetical protein